MLCVLLLPKTKKQLLGHHDEFLYSSLALLLCGRFLSCFATLAHQGTDINRLLLVAVIIIVSSIHDIKVRQLFVVFVLVKCPLCETLALIRE